MNWLHDPTELSWRKQSKSLDVDIKMKPAKLQTVLGQVICTEAFYAGIVIETGQRVFEFFVVLEIQDIFQNRFSATLLWHVFLPINPHLCLLLVTSIRWRQRATTGSQRELQNKAATNAKETSRPTFAFNAVILPSAMIAGLNGYCTVKAEPAMTENRMKRPILR